MGPQSRSKSYRDDDDDDRCKEKYEKFCNCSKTLHRANCGPLEINGASVRPPQKCTWAHMIGLGIEIRDSEVASTGMAVIPSFLEILKCFKVICRNRRTEIKDIADSYVLVTHGD
jgi:hypothetical protein